MDWHSEAKRQKGRDFVIFGTQQKPFINLLKAIKTAGLNHNSALRTGKKKKKKINLFAFSNLILTNSDNLLREFALVIQNLLCPHHCAGL